MGLLVEPFSAYDTAMKQRRTVLKTIAASLLGWVSRVSGDTKGAGPRVAMLRKQALTGAHAGMEGSLVEVTYAPGGRSASHRHPGFVLGYVIEGRLRFGVEGEAERVLGPGETFYEPAGAVHAVSANALADKPTRILAFMVAPTGRPVVEPK